MENKIQNQPKNILIFSIAYIPFVGGAELAVKEITDRIYKSDSNTERDFTFDMITLRFNKNWPKFEKIGNDNGELSLGIHKGRVDGSEWADTATVFVNADTGEYTYQDVTHREFAVGSRI